jgi:broad specificity phosphatase PhoE
MTVQITLFVHSTTTDNENNRATGHAPGKLSETGLKQAKELEEKVSDRDFDKVFCSDLHRAVKTTDIAFGDKYDVAQDQRLRECDYGEMTQEKADWEIENYVEKSYPGGESYRDVENRISDFLERLEEEHEDEHIAIVSHQAPQLALEVLTEGKTWKEAIDEDWRETGKWQPGWNYTVE